MLSLVSRCGLVTALLLSLGCGSDGPTEPVDLSGGYDLLTVNGQPTPVTVTIGDIRQIESGSLGINEDANLCVLSFWVHIQAGTGTQEGPFTPTCSYARAGNQITLTLGGGLGARTATYSRVNGARTLTLDMGSGFGLLVYRDEMAP